MARQSALQHTAAEQKDLKNQTISWLLADKDAWAENWVSRSTYTVFYGLKQPVTRVRCMTGQTLCTLRQELDACGHQLGGLRKLWLICLPDWWAR